MSRPAQELWAKLPVREPEFQAVKTHLLAGFSGHHNRPSISGGGEGFDRNYKRAILSCSSISGLVPASAGQERRSGAPMSNLINIIRSDEGQDITEYAVMLAVILVIVVGTIRLIGSNANNVFSNTASSIQ